MQLHFQILELFPKSGSKDILDQKISTVFNEWKEAQSQKILDALYVHDNSIVGKDLVSMYNGIYDIPWWRFMVAYIPEVDLSKVNCSVLAINGEKDTQVNATENLGKIKEVLTKSGNKHFDVVSIPGLNHLLQTAGTGDFSEYETIEETMSPVAMNIISNWIKLHTK